MRHIQSEMVVTGNGGLNVFTDGLENHVTVFQAELATTIYLRIRLTIQTLFATLNRQGNTGAVSVHCDVLGNEKAVNHESTAEAGIMVSFKNIVANNG